MKSIREDIVEVFLFDLRPHVWRPVFDGPNPTTFHSEDYILAIEGNRVTFAESGDPQVELELTYDELETLRATLKHEQELKR